MDLTSPVTTDPIPGVNATKAQITFSVAEGDDGVFAVTLTKQFYQPANLDGTGLRTFAMDPDTGKRKQKIYVIPDYAARAAKRHAQGVDLCANLLRDFGLWGPDETDRMDVEQQAVVDAQAVLDAANAKLKADADSHADWATVIGPDQVAVNEAKAALTAAQASAI